MSEKKYQDKLESEIKKLQKSINDSNDKIVDLMKQIKDLDKDKDIHETISLNKASNQLRQQEYYNNLVVKLKQQELNRQLNKLKLDLKLETHKQQRLKNEKKQKEQILEIQKKKQSQQQKNYERLFGRLKKQELNRQNNKSEFEERLKKQENQRLKNMPCIQFVEEGEEKKFEKERENLKQRWKKYRKDREVIFPKIDPNSEYQFNKQIIKNIFKKQEDAAKAFVTDGKDTYNRRQMYRWRVDWNGNLLNDKKPKQPLWKKYAKEGLPPLGKIKNTNSSNKNNLQNK